MTPPKRAPLPVDMLGSRVDDHIGPHLDRAAENRRGKDIVHHHGRPDRMGKARHTRKVDHFQRRVGHAFQEHRPGIGPDGGAPRVQIGAIHESNLDPVAGQHVFQHIQARPEQRPRRDHVIARAQHRHQRARHGGHARRRGEGVLGAFKGRDTLFERRDRRVAVARIDELVFARTQEPRLRGFGRRVDKALRHVDGLGHLAILAATCALMHQLRACVPILAHAIPHRPRGHAKPPNLKQVGGWPRPL